MACSRAQRYNVVCYGWNVGNFFSDGYDYIITFFNDKYNRTAHENALPASFRNVVTGCENIFSSNSRRAKRDEDTRTDTCARDSRRKILVFGLPPDGDRHSSSTSDRSGRIKPVHKTD